MISKASTRVLASCHQTWRAARICPNYRWRCIAWKSICKWMIFCLHVWLPEGNKMLVNQAKDAFCSRKQCFSTNGGFSHSCWICFFCLWKWWFHQQEVGIQPGNKWLIWQARVLIHSSAGVITVTRIFSDIDICSCYYIL